jgi:ubiquinone/menaquinone biosynthesis C-methylase UbiE
MKERRDTMASLDAHEYVDAPWRDAEAYDLEDGRFTGDLLYWCSLVEQLRPAHVLELACGTGRVALALAAAGVEYDPTFRIVGLDYSPGMLERGREKLAAVDSTISKAVTFSEGDLRNLKIEGGFDLIICAYNSLAYLHTVDDQLACLTAARRLLAPGGHFAFDLVVPQLKYLAEAEDPVPLTRLDLDELTPGSGISHLRRVYADRYDQTTQTITTAYTHEVYYNDGRQRRWVDDLAWHMYFARELELLLRLSALTPIQRYGNYERTRWTQNSKKYLWVVAALEE